MNRVNQQNNFIFLAVALVGLLLVSAVGHSIPGGLGVHFGQAMTLATLAVAYHTLNFGPRWRRFVGVTLMLILVVATVGVFNKTPEVALAYRVLGLVFFVGAIVKCSHQVLFSDSVGINVVVGALAIYLLLGIIWASLHMITLYFFPHAFKGITPEAGVDDFPRLLYFSYVTLATLGYGEITPAMPISRTLAYLEAIVGTFYLAIIVASLIGGRHNKTKL